MTTLRERIEDRHWSARIKRQSKAKRGRRYRTMLPPGRALSVPAVTALLGKGRRGTYRR